MASQPNAWQTAPRNSNNNNRSSNPSSSRNTPQNRSNAASPAQQNNPSQPPKQPSAAANPGNVWTQRAAAQQQAAQQQQSQSGSNGPSPAPMQEEAHVSVNGFNAAEVKAFLGREVGAAPAVYVPNGGWGQGGGRGSAAWGAKTNSMANGQPFFVQLAKQVAAFEGGG